MADFQSRVIFYDIEMTFFFTEIINWRLAARQR